MTARPIFLKDRRRPVYAAVALVLVMVALLLAAGCIGGDYTKDNDIRIIKLNNNGSIAWIKTIDSGKNDNAKSVIQTADGGYAITGGYSAPVCNGYGPATPTVIRLTNTGDVLWQKEYSLSSIDQSTQYPDQISGIIQNPDSGFYLISRFGTIVKLDSSGNPSWKKNVWSNGTENVAISFQPIQTRGGGIIVGGSILQCFRISDSLNCGPASLSYERFIGKLDTNGNLSWFTILSDKNITQVLSVIELSHDKGFIGFGLNKNGSGLFRLDNAGHDLNLSTINPTPTIYRILPDPEGFSAFVVNNSANNTIEELYYTDEGLKTTTKMLPNFTQSGIVTQDNAYFSVSLKGSDNYPLSTTMYVNKMDSNGKPKWDQQVTSFDTGIHLIHFWNLIETSDGGYLMVIGVEKGQAC